MILIIDHNDLIEKNIWESSIRLLSAADDDTVRTWPAFDMTKFILFMNITFGWYLYCSKVGAIYKEPLWESRCRFESMEMGGIDLCGSKSVPCYFMKDIIVG